MSLWKKNAKIGLMGKSPRFWFSKSTNVIVKAWRLLKNDIPKSRKKHEKSAKPYHFHEKKGRFGKHGAFLTFLPLAPIIILVKKVKKSVFLCRLANYKE